jgi:hypothetical protein
MSTKMKPPECAIGDDSMSVLIAVTDEMIEHFKEWEHGVKAQWRYNDAGRPVSVTFGPAAKEDPGLFLEEDDEGRSFFRIFLPYAWVPEEGESGVLTISGTTNAGGSGRC